MGWPAPKARLYEFIVRHFLACCSREALGQETVVNIDIAGESFRTTGGLRLAVPGLAAICNTEAPPAGTLSPSDPCHAPYASILLCKASI